jgi:nucleoside phosphorylase
MAAAQAILDDIHRPLPIHADYTNIYVLGSIKQHQVFITCLPTKEHYGPNTAAIVITNMKRTFPGVRVNLTVGIGGGVPSKCNVFLRDVVVGTRVMQYDLGKFARDGTFQRAAVCRSPDIFLGTAVSASTKCVRGCQEERTVANRLSIMICRFMSILQASHYRIPSPSLNLEDVVDVHLPCTNIRPSIY